jgi:hypothetical protein
MRSPIVATALLAPMPRKPTPPKAPVLFAQAFALLPFSDPNSPEATGGGNPGYNQRVHY